MGSVSIALAIALASAGPQSQQPIGESVASARDSLAAVDLRQSQIVQSGDMAALEALLHPAYTVHVPNGRIIDRQQTVGFARSGAFAKEKHRRVQERVMVSGTTGIVMGVDQLDSPPPLATRGERIRRYTNVYVLEGGRWLHLARHFHFIPDAEGGQRTR